MTTKQEQLLENKVRKIVKKVMTEAIDPQTESYYQTQLSRLQMPKTIYDKWHIKLSDGQGGGTNNINVTPEFVQILAKFVKKYSAVKSKIDTEV